VHTHGHSVYNTYHVYILLLASNTEKIHYNIINGTIACLDLIGMYGPSLDTNTLYIGYLYFHSLLKSHSTYNYTHRIQYTCTWTTDGTDNAMQTCTCDLHSYNHTVTGKLKHSLILQCWTYCVCVYWAGPVQSSICYLVEVKHCFNIIVFELFNII
jgi:hypothetical protein